MSIFSKLKRERCALDMISDGRVKSARGPVHGPMRISDKTLVIGRHLLPKLSRCSGPIHMGPCIIAVQKHAREER